jgi:hypothetical protein
MKILLIGWLHHKNREAIMSYNFQMDINNNIDNIDLTQYDVVYCVSHPIQSNKYPNTKFLFGPHFSVSPEKQQIEMINYPNSVYVMPSDWCITYWKNHECCKNLRMEAMPFGVNTNYFNEIKSILERDRIFIYFKSRDPNELNIIENFLREKQINYTIFNYQRRYNESDYINCLHNAKFGIWIGAHESQGFALEEALSCNVPLLVWNVRSMNQEYGSKYNDIPATTIPYWDNSCGEVFYKHNEIEDTYNKFINNIEKYKPREFILNNLSVEKCKKRMLEIIENI